MNKKQAIAYAQITLDFMQSPKYTGELNPETFGVEMKQCFKLYPHDIVLGIAEAQIYAAKKTKLLKNRCDANE